MGMMVKPSGMGTGQYGAAGAQGECAGAHSSAGSAAMPARERRFAGGVAAVQGSVRLGIGGGTSRVGRGPKVGGTGGGRSIVGTALVAGAGGGQECQEGLNASGSGGYAAGVSDGEEGEYVGAIGGLAKGIAPSFVGRACDQMTL